MIVIAVHDKTEYLDNLLSQLMTMNINNHEILVIDTNSKNEEFLTEYPKLFLKYPSVMFERIGYDCWDSGAYLETHRRYKRERYIFFQDSISILNPNLIVEIDQDLTCHEVSALSSFPYIYDNTEQKMWVEQDYDEKDSKPALGIFGPMFAVYGKTIDRISPKRFTVLPKTKLQQQGMERRWSLMFHEIGASVSFRSAGIDLYKKNDDIEKIFLKRQ